MLLVIGAGLIGAAWFVLLGLIVASRLTAGRRLADGVVAERITVSLIAALAIGLICVELHPTGRPPEASSPLEVALLLATLGGFALLGAWFWLCRGVRSDRQRRPGA